MGYIPQKIVKSQLELHYFLCRINATAAVKGLILSADTNRVVVEASCLLPVLVTPGSIPGAVSHQMIEKSVVSYLLGAQE